MIKIRNLNKYYHKGKSNEIHVIDNTSLTLENTGLVCILGESGSGKTTLMNTISGLDNFHDGEIEIDGTVVKKYGDKNQEMVRNEKFGYIFQNYYLLQDRTVEYNLMLGLSLYDIPDEEKQERIDYVLKTVDMWKYKKRKVSNLSGGQQQRIAIARALSKSPKIIFADEPTGNLDEANTMRIMSILKKISEKCLVVLVTHEKAIADFFADRILWISDGKIQKEVDRSQSDSYEYVEDVNLYLGEYEKQEVEDGNISLEIYANEPVPQTDIQLICENGKVYLKAAEDQEIIFLDSTDEKKMLEGKKPVVDMEDLKSFEFSLEHIRGAKRPKMSAAEIRELAMDNIRAFGKKQLFLIITLLLMSVLTVLTQQNFLAVQRVDEKSILTEDSHYYHLTAQKNAMITDSEYREEFSQMIDKLSEAGIENAVVPVVQLSYRYQGFEQMEEITYTLKNYTLVTLDKVGEKDLLYGRMPENDMEIVVDQWVIENFIQDNPQVEIAMSDISQAVGASIVTKEGMEMTITGVAATNQPDIYVDRDTLVAMASVYVNYKTDTKAKEEYAGYEGTDLGMDESGRLKVLVSEKAMQIKFRDDMIRQYGDLEACHEVVEQLEIQAEYVGKVSYGSAYSAEDAARELPYARQRLEEKEKKYGITYEEYEQLIDVNAEDAAYKTYSYEGILTNGVPFVTAGYFPTNYGIDYIISDDSVQYIAKSIMNTGKECYLYIEDDSISEEALLKQVQSIIGDEIAGNITLSIKNEAHTDMDKFLQEKQRKIGIQIVMLVTVFAITLIILYFMMKTNVVTRMQDLGVYRMLGISKHSIMAMFAWENIVITSYTSLVGVIATTAVTWVLSRIPSLGMEYDYPWQILIATIAALYLFNVVIGILPVRKMLRLPPAQLAAKYDF